MLQSIKKNAKMKLMPNQLGTLKETKLVEVLEKKGSHVAPATKKTALEVNSGFGIADIVYFNIDEDSVQKRHDAGFPAVSSYEILETFSVINKLKEDCINITYLHKKLPYSEKIFKEKILGFLIQNNIVENVDNTYLKLKYTYEIPINEVIAVEAKISNWKRGLYQAYRYKQYADKSYLALHTNYLQRAMKNISIFIDLNIGLIEVNDQTEEIKKIFEPKKNALTINEKVRLFASEDILQKYGYIN